MPEIPKAKPRAAGALISAHPKGVSFSHPVSGTGIADIDDAITYPDSPKQTTARNKSRIEIPDFTRLNLTTQ